MADIPIPDPTVVTTQTIQREIGHLREALESKIDAERDACAQQFAFIEKQFALLEAQRRELKIDTAASRLEQKTDTKLAVDAALTAQKQAVRKQEIATDTQLSQLSATFGTQIGNILNKAGDLGERIGKIENVRLGGKENTANYVMALGALMMVIQIVSVVAIYTK